MRAKTSQPGIYSRSGRYEIAYTDSSGRRVFKMMPHGMPFKDVVQARNSILARMYRGEYVAPSKLTVSELADRFMDEATNNLKESTKKTYQGSIDAHIKRLLGTKKVSDLGKRDVIFLINEIGKDRAAWTVHGVLTPLSRIMDYAVDEGFAASNPVKALNRQQRPSGFTKPMRILDTNEINLLLKNCSEGSRVLFLTALFTGLRSGELYRLRWKDIDFDQSLINVVESKTDAGVRFVTVPEFVLQELAAKALVSPSEFAFQTGRQSKASWAGNARMRLKNALTRCGVEGHLRFHDLRHTYASIMISQGFDVTFVAKQMGHTTPAITLQLYAKLFDPEQRMKEAREKIHAAFMNVTR